MAHPLSNSSRNSLSNPIVSGVNHCTSGFSLVAVSLPRNGIYRGSQTLHGLMGFARPTVLGGKMVMRPILFSRLLEKSFKTRPVELLKLKGRSCRVGLPGEGFVAFVLAWGGYFRTSAECSKEIIRKALLVQNISCVVTRYIAS